MCNNPGAPVGFQEGGEVFGTVAGRPVSVGTPGAYQPGITDLAYGLMQQQIDLPGSRLRGSWLTNSAPLILRGRA
jgi:hypothetical protein